MKKKFALLCSLLITGFLWSQTSQIKMEITGIENDKGTISLALYDNANDFTKTETRRQKLNPQKGKVYAKFNKLPAGTYAVAVLHDANKNDKMDFTLIGIPKEKYGFSRNPKIILSAPSFEEVNFRLNENETKHLKIQLK